MPAPGPLDTASSPGERQGVVVLGMGRSGTSVVSQAFARSGFYCGEESDLLAADSGNPNGYFERTDLIEFNERVLSELDGSWFAPPSKDRFDSCGEDYQLLVRGLCERLADPNGVRPLVAKDPRIGVLMPIWWPAVQDIFHPLLVVRSPLEIARSIAKQHQRSIAFGLAAWEVHMTGLIGALEGQTVTLARYRSVVHNTDYLSDIVTGASEQLRSDLRSVVDASAAVTAPDTRLHRNRAELEANRDLLTGFQLDLWNELAAIPDGTVQLSTADRLHSPSDLAWELVHEQRRLDLIAHQNRVEAHEARVEAHGARVEAHEARVEAHEARVEAHEAKVEVHELRVKNHDLELELSQLQA